MEDHLEHLRELFGDRWADALHVAEMFRLATGFVLLDIHPGNIAFAGLAPPTQAALIRTPGASPYRGIAQNGCSARSRPRPHINYTITMQNRVFVADCFQVGVG